MTPDPQYRQLNIFESNTDDTEKFFIKKRHWSAAKHRILLRYLQSFCYNLGGDKAFQSKYLNYVDGFAGVGKYDEGIGIEDFVNNSKFWLNRLSSINQVESFEDTDGSPLIALKCSKIFEQEKRVNLKCFLIESNPISNKKLQQNCQLIGNKASYKVYDPIAFDRAFPQLLSELNGYPTLFFLDTFGVKGVTFEHIYAIGQYVQKYKGEMFILFHNRQVARHAGQSTAKSNDAKTVKAAQTYTKNLTALLGSGSEEIWKKQWSMLKQQEIPQAFERWALEYLKEKISKEVGFRGVTSFPVNEKHNDIRPQYHIIVGSNHPEKAFGFFLNDFIHDEDKLLFFREQNYHQQIEQFLEKSWQSIVKERKQEVIPTTREVLNKNLNRWITFDEMITQIILSLKDLGKLKRTHYYQILGELYNQGIIEVKNPGKSKPYTLKSLLKLKS